MYMTKEIRTVASKLGRKLQNCEIMAVDAYLDLDTQSDGHSDSTDDESD